MQGQVGSEYGRMGEPLRLSMKIILKDRDMNFKYLNAVILIIALASFSNTVSFGQTVSKSEEFTEFHTIEANESFNLLYKEGPDYLVSWKVDKALSDYVEIYVSKKVLNINFNKKALTKEIKQAYKGKNAPKPVFDVVIQAPSLDRISLTDKVVFKAGGQTLSSQDFSLSLSGEAKVENLKISANTVNIEVAKSSNASLKIQADDITATASNSSELDLSYKTGTLTLTGNGSSKINCEGSASGASVNTQGSASVTLSGSADRLDVQSNAFSKQNLSGFSAKKAYTKAFGSSDVIVNASEVLSVEIKGAKMQFLNDPLIEIVSINNGSLLRYSK